MGFFPFLTSSRPSPTYSHQSLLLSAALEGVYCCGRALVSVGRRHFLRSLGCAVGAGRCCRFLVAATLPHLPVAALKGIVSPWSPLLFRCCLLLCGTQHGVAKPRWKLHARFRHLHLHLKAIRQSERIRAVTTRGSEATIQCLRAPISIGAPNGSTHGTGEENPTPS